MLKKEEISNQLHLVNEKISKFLATTPLGIKTPVGLDVNEYKKLVKEREELIKKLKSKNKNG